MHLFTNWLCIIRIKISMIIKYPLFLYSMLKRLSKELLGFSLGCMYVWIDGWIREWKDRLTIESSTSTCPKRLSLYEKESVFSSVHAFNDWMKPRYIIEGLQVTWFTCLLTMFSNTFKDSREYDKNNTEEPFFFPMQ